MFCCDFSNLQRYHLGTQFVWYYKLDIIIVPGDYLHKLLKMPPVITAFAVLSLLLHVANIDGNLYCVSDSRCLLAGAASCFWKTIVFVYRPPRNVTVTEASRRRHGSVTPIWNRHGSRSAVS